MSTIVLFLSAILAASLAAPAVEKVEDNAVEQAVVDAEATTVAPDSNDEVVEVDSTAVPEDEATTLSPTSKFIPACGSSAAIIQALF